MNFFHEDRTKKEEKWMFNVLSPWIIPCLCSYIPCLQVAWMLLPQKSFPCSAAHKFFRRNYVQTHLNNNLQQCYNNHHYWRLQEKCIMWNLTFFWHIAIWSEIKLPKRSRLIHYKTRDWHLTNLHCFANSLSQKEQSAAPPAIVPSRYGLISITFFTVWEAKKL